MIKEIEVQKFLKYLKSNGNLERLTTNLDNKRSPIHRWFPFLVGFSHLLVKETINYFLEEKNRKDYFVFDPFMGSGTTGVVGREIGVNVFGNEVNPFLYKICKVKTSLHRADEAITLKAVGKEILTIASKQWRTVNTEMEHPLLVKCYPTDNLKKLIMLRKLIMNDVMISERQRSYLYVILTRCLLRSSYVGINIPYVSWSSKQDPRDAFMLFEENLRMICHDLTVLSKSIKDNVRIEVFLHDSRTKNQNIPTRSVDMVFTSPPYLNNFDYGEALKVFLYFWKIANNWAEITDKIRKVGVASATTYYNEHKMAAKPYEKILGRKILKAAPNTSQEIILKAELIKAEMTKRRKSRKSFDLLTLLYFRDMFDVLKELYRVLENDALCFFVIGDSAPYGVYVPTDTILGEMGVEIGFSSYTLQPLRKRGIKWKTLTHRHNKELRESLLILRR